MKKITKTTDYWFLKPTEEMPDAWYIRIKTSGIDKISWVIGYENSNHLISRINCRGGFISTELFEQLENEFQNEISFLSR